MVGYCFVNDSKIFQAAPFPNIPTYDTAKLAQKGLKIFSGAARATGGQVSVQKKVFLGVHLGPVRKITLSK